MLAMRHLTYDPALVEEAVLLAEGAMPDAEARVFRGERDPLYGIADPERRDAAFQSLHLRWFTRLALHESVWQAVAEREDIVQRLDEGRVLRALAPRDEGADLVDQLAPGRTDTRAILVLRLRPETVLEPARVRSLLRHELMHVADMIDPAFGYERTLPCSDDGPSRDNVLRDRYRVLWDVTIDGRLARAGRRDAGDSPPDRRVRLQPDQPAPTRDVRWREFSATFSMLGDDGQAAFEEWFDRIRPTHARLVAFAQDPRGRDASASAHAGRCPLCRFPVASLDPRPDRLSPVTEAAIRDHHPSWRIDQGLCAQCLDLYEARYGQTSDAGCR